MRTFSIALAGLAALASIAAAPMGGSVCYDLDANVNGEQIVDEADCLEAPAPMTSSAAQPGELCYDVNVNDVVAEADCIELP